MPKKSNDEIIRERPSDCENLTQDFEEMSCSAFLNDIAKNVKSLTLKKIKQKSTEASGVSQCTRAILKSLSRKTGVTELALCRDINYTAPTVSVALKRMAYDDLLKLVINPSNKRETFIYITDKGIETGKYLDQEYRELDNILLNGLSDEEKAVLPSIFGKMMNNLTAALEEANAENSERTPMLKMMNAKLYNEMLRKKEQERLSKGANSSKSKNMFRKI